MISGGIFPHGRAREQIVKDLDQKENRELFSCFVDEVDQIAFAVMVSIGCKQSDKLLWNELLVGFERWMRNLKEGKMDDKEGFFSNGASNVWQFMHALKKREMPRLIAKLSKSPIETNKDMWETVTAREARDSVMATRKRLRSKVTQTETDGSEVDGSEKGNLRMLDLSARARSPHDSPQERDTRLTYYNQKTNLRTSMRALKFDLLP